MNESLTFILTCSAGALLGLFYFGGLLWTVHKALSARRPTFLMSGSLLLRMIIVLVAFYFVGGGVWQRYGACLFGFVLMRFVVLHWKRLPVEHMFRRAKEAHHAPQSR